MKTFFKTMLVLGLVIMLASLALGVAAIGWLGDGPGIHFSIDGEDWSSHGFGLGGLGDLLGGLGGMMGTVIAAVVVCLVACLIVGVVVPLALLLGLGLPLLIVGGLAAAGLAALAGIGAVLGSPLLLLGLVIWLLVRDKPKKAAAAR